MTPQEYEKSELRLIAIDKELQNLAKDDNAPMSKVIDLRDEARVLLKDLRAFISENFKTD